MMPTPGERLTVFGLRQRVSPSVDETLAESSAQKALADIETKIEKLTAELNKIQALDLRWAIGGLFISAIGTFLGYWA
jgi:hypothetical protein